MKQGYICRHPEAESIMADHCRPGEIFMHQWNDKPDIIFTYFDDKRSYAVSSSYRFSGNALAQLRKWIESGPREK